MRNSAETIGYAVAHLVIDAAVLWAAYLLVDSEVLRDRPPLAMVQGLFLAYFSWIAILLVGGVVHELGHGLVAYALRLRMIYALLGPFRVSLAGPTRRVAWNRHWLTMPFAVAFAPALGGSARSAWAMAMLAGPLASLLLAGIAFATLSEARDASSFAAATLTGLVWFGLAGFVGNLIPGRVGLKRTDGGHLLALLRREPQLESSWALSGIVAAWTTGSRPREVGPQELHTLLAVRAPTHLRAAALIAALHVARDRGEDGGERDLAAELASLASELTPPLRAALCCELAITFAAHGTPDEAQGWLERARPDRPDQDDLWRAEAAVSFAQDKDAQARSAITKARAAIARMQVVGLIAGSGRETGRTG